jgi:hypothetical protein
VAAHKTIVAKVFKNGDMHNPFQISGHDLKVFLKVESPKP